MKRREFLRTGMGGAAALAAGGLPVAAEAGAASRLRQVNVAGGYEVFELGRTAWDRPWLPDLRRPNALGQAVAVPMERRIDVVVLGDGYTPSERAHFYRKATEWYDRFLSYSPYREMRGIFRVRAVWTPSAAHCTPDRNTYYRIGTKGKEVGLWGSKETREAVWAILDGIGVNPLQTTPHSNHLTHTFVGMLVRGDETEDLSGWTRRLRSPDNKRIVNFAMGEHATHEFTHAYGLVKDEYINHADSVARLTTPRQPSLYTVSNICYSRDPARIPWMHYAPGSALNPDRNSLVGLLWEGGVYDIGAWHCQPHCLMNGIGKDNWDLQHTHFGAKSLRDFHHFCVWCREIIAARTYHRAGFLGEDGDGITLWNRWVTDFRPGFERYFLIAEHIRAYNEEIARAGLVTAKLYTRPMTPDELAHAKPEPEAPQSAAPDADDPDDPTAPEGKTDAGAGGAKETDGQ